MFALCFKIIFPENVMEKIVYFVFVIEHHTLNLLHKWQHNV